MPAQPDPDEDLYEGLTAEERRDVQIGARSRVLADRMKTRQAEAKQPCPRCGKPKGEGEHGEGKCQEARRRRSSFG